jgi:hypothetical protein
MKRFELPSEHGFWVMLPAALIAALIRVDWSQTAVAAALVAALAAILAGGFAHRLIRKKPAAQVVSSALLALLMVPVEVAGSATVQPIAFDVVAWMALFAGSSLAVRASFARARRAPNGAWKLTLASLFCPALALPLLFNTRYPLRVAAVAVVGCAIFALWRPKPRQLKTAGLTLAGIVLLALGTQVVG